MKNNNYSNPNTFLTSNEPFLNSSAYDLELYKFFNYQEKDKFDNKTSLYNDIMQIFIYINANDIIKFLINEAQKYLDIESIFSICTQVDHDCAILYS